MRSHRNLRYPKYSLPWFGLNSPIFTLVPVHHHRGPPIQLLRTYRPSSPLISLPDAKLEGHCGLELRCQNVTAELANLPPSRPFSTSRPLLPLWITTGRPAPTRISQVITPIFQFHTGFGFSSVFTQILPCTHWRTAAPQQTPLLVPCLLYGSRRMYIAPLCVHSSSTNLSFKPLSSFAFQLLNIFFGHFQRRRSADFLLLGCCYLLVLFVQSHRG